MRRIGVLLSIAALVVAIAAIGARPNRFNETSQLKVRNKTGIPHQINYQGYLTDNSENAITDTLGMTFSIWDAPSVGSQLWDETQTDVAVIDGLFNVLLGSVTPIPSSVFSNPACWLQTEIVGEILSPRKELVSIGYAFRADTADYAIAAPSDNDWQVDGNNMHSIPTDNVGIGTSSPEKKLHLSSPTSIYGMLLIENSNTGDNEATIAFKEGSDAGGVDIWVAGVGSWGNTNDFVIGRGGVKFLVTPDGDVGIGTSSPSDETKLHIQAVSDNFGVLVDGGGTSGSEIGLHSATSKYASLAKNCYYDGAWKRFNTNSGAFLQEVQPDGDVLFRTIDAGTNPISWINALTIKTDGKVGIGIMTPVYDLDVDGSIKASGSLGIGVYGSAGLTGVRGESVGYGVYGKGVIGIYGEADTSIIASAIAGCFDGKVGIGTSVPEEKLHVVGTVKCEVLKLTGGSDIAEPFDIKETDGIRAGMVLTIDPENTGKLKISERAYDRCVAGIISGGGGIESGILMGQSGSAADGEYPVALTGRVYCWADASNGPIQPGDLLTTSETPGHSMKVTDYVRAQGAVIGKAMSSLDKGKGLVLILVALQ